MLTRKLKVLIAACALSGATAAVAAYPDKPVTIVVPFPGGQTGDIIARAIGEQLSKRLRQPFIIENRPGAGGTIGSTYAARAAHDGYTLLMVSTGPFAIAPALYSKLPYAPLRDFEAVADVASTPQVLAVSPASGVDSIAALIDRAKTGELSFASAGNGSTQHLSMEVFAKETGIKVLHIPFKGSAEAQTQVMSGLIPVLSDSLPAILPQIKAGKLRALAVLDTKRSEYLPDLATLSEQGYPGFSTLAFFGLVAPKGTPADVVAKLNAAVLDSLSAPQTLTQFRSLALTPAKPRTAAESGTYLAGEVAKWKKVVDDAGAKID